MGRSFREVSFARIFLGSSVEVGVDGSGVLCCVGLNLIGADTWIGMVLVLGGIALCVQWKNNISS